MKNNIYQNAQQQNQFDQQEIKSRKINYKSDRQQKYIDWAKFQINPQNFQKNHQTFYNLCLQLKLKHNDPIVKQKATQYVQVYQYIEKKNQKINKCSQQIQQVQKKLKEIYSNIDRKQETILNCQAKIQEKNSKLQYSKKFLNQKMVLVDVNRKELKQPAQKSIQSYCSKEGVEELKKQIYNFSEQEKEILKMIKYSFEDNYKDEFNKHITLQGVLDKLQQSNKKLIQARIDSNEKDNQYKKLCKTLAEINDDIKNEKNNTQKLEQELSQLKNKKANSKAQIGNSASQILPQKFVFQQKVNIITKRDYFHRQEGFYSQWINYGLYLWAFLLIVLFLKETPLSASIEPDIPLNL